MAADAVSTKPRLPATTASTVFYLNRDGVVYSVFHHAPSATWQHPFSRDELSKCPTCCRKYRREL